MKYIIDILKGSIMGIANIVPGLSGSTMAIAMGIYDKLINAINNITKSPLQSLKSIWIYLVGMVIGLVFGVFVISYTLDLYPLATSMLFVGLIIGIIPIIYKRVDKSNIDYKKIIAFVLTAVFILVLPVLSKLDIINLGNNVIMFFLIGVISAGTMIIPGVSGSMMLMALGYYNDLTSMITTTIKEVLKFNFMEVKSEIILLIFFTIGIIVGIVLIAKLIKYLFGKFNQITNVVILSLIVTSPITVLMEVNYLNVGITNVIVSVFTLAIGYYISSVFNKEEKK